MHIDFFWTSYLYRLMEFNYVTTEIFPRKTIGEKYCNDSRSLLLLFKLSWYVRNSEGT